MNEADAGSHERSSRAELRRRAIIQTARRLFVEHGFHATGVAQIARKSGIAVGQMYRDFTSKEDIVAALAQEDCATLMRADALKSAIRSGEPEAAMTWLLGLLELDEDRDARRLFAEIVAESARNERISAIFKAVQVELRSAVMQALLQIAPGPDLEGGRSLLADMLLSFSLGLLHHDLTVPGFQSQPLVRAMQNIFKDQVRALTTARAPG